MKFLDIQSAKFWEEVVGFLAFPPNFLADWDLAYTLEEEDG